MSVGLCIPTYHVRNNYVTYIVAMPLALSNGVATVSSLAQ